MHAAEIKSDRLLLRTFADSDVNDVFECITPEITRYMAWEPPTRATFHHLSSKWLTSIKNGLDMYFVVRQLEGRRCLGIVAIHSLQSSRPELGIWLREDAHGRGYGIEAIATAMLWACEMVKPECFEYPVAEDNVASRSIAEHLGGIVTGRRANEKYVAVVYNIPCQAQPLACQ